MINSGDFWIQMMKGFSEFMDEENVNVENEESMSEEDDENIIDLSERDYEVEDEIQKLES